MRHGYHQRRRLDYRDISPHTGSEDSIAERAYREQLSVTESFGFGSLGGGELQTYRYVSPAGNGRHIVESPLDPTKTITIPSAPNVEGFVPGQWVLTGQTQAGPAIIAHPPGAEKGLSRHAVTERSASIDLVEITSANPSEIQIGATTNVTLTGVGFLASPLDTFAAVKFDETAPSSPWIADSLVTLGTPSFVSVTEVTIAVTLDSATEVGYLVNIRVQRT